MSIQEFHDDDEKNTGNTSNHHGPITAGRTFVKEQDSSDHYPGWRKVLKPNSIRWRSANQSGQKRPVHADETNRHRNHGPMKCRLAH